jgi:hypothetical protein
MNGSVVLRLVEEEEGEEEEGGEKRNPDCSQWFMGPAKGKEAKGGSRSRQITR